jgi:hypothetical protein
MQREQRNRLVDVALHLAEHLFEAARRRVGKALLQQRDFVGVGESVACCEAIGGADATSRH